MNFMNCPNCNSPMNASFNIYACSNRDCDTIMTAMQLLTSDLPNNNTQTDQIARQTQKENG
jgi:hypothetical protein